MAVTFPFVCREKSRCALRGGRNGFHKAAASELARPATEPSMASGPAAAPRPGRVPTAWAPLAGGTHAAGTGRPSLHSIVFLNAFMNNSERNYYSLAGSQGPAQCCSVGLRAAKVNTLPAPPRVSPVFQINHCLSQRACGPCFQTGGDTALLFLTWPIIYSTAAQAPTAAGLGWLWAPLPLCATLRGGHAEHSPRVVGPQ